MPTRRVAMGMLREVVQHINQPRGSSSCAEEPPNRRMSVVPQGTGNSRVLKNRHAAVRGTRVKGRLTRLACVQAGKW